MIIYGSQPAMSYRGAGKRHRIGQFLDVVLLAGSLEGSP